MGKHETFELHIEKRNVSLTARCFAMAPRPVFLPRKLHGQRSLVGYSPRGCKELDMTERTSTTTREVCGLGSRVVTCCKSTAPRGCQPCHNWMQVLSWRKIKRHTSMVPAGHPCAIQTHVSIQEEPSRIPVGLSYRLLGLLSEPWGPALRFSSESIP